MTTINKDQIDHILSNLHFSDHSSLKSRASKIIISDKKIGFSVDITNLEFPDAQRVAKDAEKQLKKLLDVEKASIVLTSSQSQEVQKKQQTSEKPKLHIEGVKKVMLIASGKGGVGKSTIAALLAHKLRSEGKKVGVMDADIYGPSIPQIFNLQGKPELEDDKMIPLKNHDIAVNSIGFLTDPSSSISWRGPMVSKAIYQLLSLTKWNKWGDLDYLIIDSPPGTGDIHLSILQNYIIDEVIMVTTPQKVSKINVARAINLYKKFDVVISGIVENMSYFLDQDTGKKIAFFSGNSGYELSEFYDIPLISKIKVSHELSHDCDEGKSLAKYVSLLGHIPKA